VTGRLRSRRAIAGALAVAALVGSPVRPAAAALDPAAAQAAIDAARRENDYAFCRKPRVPMSNAARELCEHAGAISACGGFVAACASKDAPLAQCMTNEHDQEPKKNDPIDLGDRFLLLATAARWLLWGLLAALAAFIVGQVILAVKRARRDRALADDPTPEPVADAAPTDPASAALSDEEALLRRGDRHAQAGELALALHFYLRAALQSLERRGALRLGRDRTNGEYLRTCADGDARPLLRDIVREVERVQFGREDASAEGVAAVGLRAAAIVRSVAVASLVLALFGLAACGDNPCFQSTLAGDDPAGIELFSDLMEKQGVRVAPLGRALASLGPQEWWRTTSAAVVVDVERVGLDGETRRHLGEWVAGGGVAVLAGASPEWPPELGVHTKIALDAHDLSVILVGAQVTNDDDDEPKDLITGGALVRPQALELPPIAQPLAWSGDKTVRAGLVPYGQGRALVLSTDELFTNAALARPGNAAALTAILAHLGRNELLVAQPDDGVAPPSSPFTSLARAGLGLGLWHALVAVLVVFAAIGARHTKPRPAAPPARRAFAEHVRAVGGLYARTSNGAHALGAYSGFAEERLRGRMPRGTTDVPAYLASRARRPLEECQRLWERAVEARAGGAPRGDELSVLQQLSTIVIAATAPEGATSHEDP
jgi:hypothetical protein